MERVLGVDEGSYITAAKALKEAADSFGQHTDALLAAIAGGGRSPWGIGVIGLAMDEVNERLGQACHHVRHNLDTTCEALLTTADHHADTRLVITDAMRALGREPENG
ncbi:MULTISPECIES: hypothetical protein [unclassified Streptosporangium]|uniref:hypothetical protein n=1 Tax=unclassified Streptosporangium TaxID=2632669 RepID=UPI002E282A5E|nr:MULTISPECIES: hypothetical protein [unclassified Streptosporangium]